MIVKFLQLLFVGAILAAIVLAWAGGDDYGAQHSGNYCIEPKTHETVFCPR